MRRSISFFILFLFLTSCEKSKPELNIYIWGDFIKQELIEEFEERHHCRVVLDTYDSNEAMYAKLKSGATGYDLIFPTGYILTVMEAQGMIEPLDKELIPNLKNLDYNFLKMIRETPHENSVPYAVTFSSIAYRKDKVKDPINSWKIFGRRDLKGRMTLLNDMREVLGAALKTHGFSINSRDAREIETAKNQVIAWKKNIAKFESEQYKNGIASAEYLVVQGYSSDIMQVSEEDPDVVLMLPDEGAIFSCDYVTIPKEAGQILLAHAFIDFILEGEVAATNMEANFYLSPNKAALFFLDEELKNNPAIFPPLDFLKKSESIQDLGGDVRLYLEAWDAIKAARN